MRTEPKESLGYDNREPKGQDEYAKGQHDLCCQELGLEPRHDREGDTLLEAVCALKKDRDDWKEEAALRKEEKEVWRHEAEIVRKQLESEHENAIDWFISCQELKTAIWDTLKMCEDRVPAMWSLNPLKLAYAKAKSAETSLDSENDQVEARREVPPHPSDG